MSSLNIQPKYEEETINNIINKYLPSRISTYESCKNVGIALKTIGMDFEVFDKWSKQGNNYNYYENKEQWDRFDLKSFGFKSLLNWLEEDNPTEYKIFCEKREITDLNYSKICRTVFKFKGNEFLYKKNGNNLQFYALSPNGYWASGDYAESIFNEYISTIVYKYYKNLAIKYLDDPKILVATQRFIKKLTEIHGKKEILNLYQGIGIKNIDFDLNWWLFPFENCVFDLKEKKFRNYKPEDYVSLTCGYIWREPTKQEIDELTMIIYQIQHKEIERNYMLDLFSKALEGKLFENFVIFTGNGGNGKSVIDEIAIKAFGQFGYKAPITILIKNKTSDPEKASLDKKRLVVFSEPNKEIKLQNNVIRELTNNTIMARDGNTEKHNHGTYIFECNKEPFLADDIEIEDVRRIKKLFFASRFTNDVKPDPENHIYPQNPKYKEQYWLSEIKFAFMKLLLDRYNGDMVLKASDDMITCTKVFMTKNDEKYNFFMDHYTITDNPKDTIKVVDIWKKYIEDPCYTNLSAKDKKMDNIKTFVKFIEDHPYLEKYYSINSSNIAIIKNCVVKISVDDK